MEFLNFKYGKMPVSASEIFPQLDITKLREFSARQLKEAFNLPKIKLPKENPFITRQHLRMLGGDHEIILRLALQLWKGGYDELLQKFGFHDKEYLCFSGHCHQTTPSLGIVLKSLGIFDRVSYLECFRIDPETKRKVNPEKEPNPEVREEFIKIGRIPYCTLEVFIGGVPFYLSSKHIKEVDGIPRALLTPVCYRNKVGTFAHQDDKSKSGIYLDVEKKEPVIWRKQTFSDPEPEYFKTFAHMELVLD